MHWWWVLQITGAWFCVALVILWLWGALFNQFRARKVPKQDAREEDGRNSGSTRPSPGRDAGKPAIPKLD